MNERPPQAQQEANEGTCKPNLPINLCSLYGRWAETPGRSSKTCLNAGDWSLRTTVTCIHAGDGFYAARTGAACASWVTSAGTRRNPTLNPWTKREGVWKSAA